MKEKPLVSIITVCYNSEKHIEDTIKSVLNQTYDNIEYIIIDGNSTDGTLDIIEEYEPKFNGRMKWISEEDAGIYDAMNKGIDIANGEIIGIINSDDYYVEDAVETIVSKFSFNQEIDVVYGNMFRIIPNSYVNLQEVVKSSIKGLEKKMTICHPTCFVKTRVYKAIGKFNVQYKIAADYELILRMKKAKMKFYYADKVLCYFRADGISSNNIYTLLDVKNIHLQYGFKVYGITNYIKRLVYLYFKRMKKNIICYILGERKYYKFKKFFWEK
ncbi:MAG: glycosyl transferase family 2 [Candidatus Frackibacter sp. T328-2]|nr:MAG: glycosyl transferase family 2 [Candidatus Frackibacter sp. T328-2]